MALVLRNKIIDPGNDEEAQELQARLRRNLRLGDQFRTVAGVDVAYSSDDRWGYVAACVLSTTTWSVVSEQRIKVPVARSYESGMLGFREGPLLVEALLRLSIEPDLILVDGNGIAHPRQFGSACHVGYTLEHPTIGVAKHWPAGCRQSGAITPRVRNSRSALLHDPSGDRVGYEVYTQNNTNPVYVSPGNRVSIEDAVGLVLRCSPSYRIPEPIRAADHAAREFRRSEEGEH